MYSILYLIFILVKISVIQTINFYKHEGQIEQKLHELPKEKLKFITTIPKGSKNILINELENTQNYILLWNINNESYPLHSPEISLKHDVRRWNILIPSENYVIANATFRYERKPHLFYGSDSLSTNQTINESLDVYLLLNDGRISVEFSMEIPENVVVIGSNSFRWITEDWLECSSSCGEGISTRKVHCFSDRAKSVVVDSLCENIKIKFETKKNCFSQKNCLKTPKWFATPWNDCGECERKMEIVELKNRKKRSDYYEYNIYQSDDYNLKNSFIDDSSSSSFSQYEIDTSNDGNDGDNENYQNLTKNKIYKMNSNERTFIRMKFKGKRSRQLSCISLILRKEIASSDIDLTGAILKGEIPIKYHPVTECMEEKPVETEECDCGESYELIERSSGTNKKICKEMKIIDLLLKRSGMEMEKEFKEFYENLNISLEQFDENEFTCVFRNSTENSIFDVSTDENHEKNCTLLVNEMFEKSATFCSEENYIDWFSINHIDNCPLLCDSGYVPVKFTCVLFTNDKNEHIELHKNVCDLLGIKNKNSDFNYCQTYIPCEQAIWMKNGHGEHICIAGSRAVHENWCFGKEPFYSQNHKQINRTINQLPQWIKVNKKKFNSKIINSDRNKSNETFQWFSTDWELIEKNVTHSIFGRNRRCIKNIETFIGYLLVPESDCSQLKSPDLRKYRNNYQLFSDDENIFSIDTIENGDEFNDYNLWNRYIQFNHKNKERSKRDEQNQLYDNNFIQHNSCDISKYGCCLDGLTTAQGENYEGCSHRLPRLAKFDKCLERLLDNEIMGNGQVFWYFNKEFGKCEKIKDKYPLNIVNQFQSEDECQSTCIEPREVEDWCYMPKIEGKCSGNELGGSGWQFYFDTITNKCEMFTYSGCNGNKNRFGTEFECLKLCKYGEFIRKDQIQNSQDFPLNFDLIRRQMFNVDDVCGLPSEQGPCRGQYNRWFYNAKIGICAPMVYGGCKGNANNFIKKEDCENRCKKGNSNFRCVLPKSRGTCHDMLRRWYFNVKSMKCEQFSYSGCDGNGNQFHSKEQCVVECGGTMVGIESNMNQNNNLITKIESRCDATAAPETVFEVNSYFDQRKGVQIFVNKYQQENGDKLFYYFNKISKSCQPIKYYRYESILTSSDQENVMSILDYEKRSREDIVNSNLFLNLSICEKVCEGKNYDICKLEFEAGSCDNWTNKYYYDDRTGRCQQFYYGGCDGNKNNFDSEFQCYFNCNQDVIREKLKEKEQITTTPILTLPTTTTLNILEEDIYGMCSMSMLVGIPCSRNVSHHLNEWKNYWYYDIRIQLCSQFFGHQCGGNLNRFLSEDECTKKCKYSNYYHPDIGYKNENNLLLVSNHYELGKEPELSIRDAILNWNSYEKSNYQMSNYNLRKCSSNSNDNLKVSCGYLNEYSNELNELLGNGLMKSFLTTNKSLRVFSILNHVERVVFDNNFCRARNISIIFNFILDDETREILNENLLNVLSENNSVLVNKCFEKKSPSNAFDLLQSEENMNIRKLNSYFSSRIFMNYKECAAVCERYEANRKCFAQRQQIRCYNRPNDKKYYYHSKKKKCQKFPDRVCGTGDNSFKTFDNCDYICDKDYFTKETTTDDDTQRKIQNLPTPNSSPHPTYPPRERQTQKPKTSRITPLFTTTTSYSTIRINEHIEQCPSTTRRIGFCRKICEKLSECNPNEICCIDATLRNPFTNKDQRCCRTIEDTSKFILVSGNKRFSNNHPDGEEWLRIRSPYNLQCETNANNLRLYDAQNKLLGDTSNEATRRLINNNINIMTTSNSIFIGIYRINKQHYGTWRCLSSVNGVTLQRSVMLKEEEPLRVHVTPNDQRKHIDVSAQINCIVNGKPQANVKWQWRKSTEFPYQQLNTNLNAEVRRIPSENGINYLLRLRRIQSNNAGIYECVATDNLGRMERRTSILHVLNRRRTINQDRTKITTLSTTSPIDEEKCVDKNVPGIRCDLVVRYNICTYRKIFGEICCGCKK
ncbi:hypothetical protein SNEBB_007813 [Seison nebaliae]|nr:hypothetical protein SNEBB_007813 [Seison nebaliae]